MKNLIILLALIISGTINGQSTINKIKKQGFINIGTSGNQLPYSYMQEDGSFVGLDIDLGNKIAEELGVKAIFIEISIPNLITALKDSTIDLIISGFTITNERNLEIMFTEPYFETGKAILSKNSHLLSGKISKINKSDVTLVALKKSSSIEMIKTHYPDAKVIEGKGIQDCMNILKSDSADAFIGDIEICDYNVNSSELQSYDYSILEAKDSNDHEFIAIGLRPGDMLFYNFINNFIKRQKNKNGENWIEDSWEKYYDYQ